MEELEWVFCRCERCSHGWVASRRSSEPPSGRQQAEGASGQGDPFLFGKEPVSLWQSTVIITVAGHYRVSSGVTGHRFAA